MMTTFEKIIKNLNRIERELVKPEAERRDIIPKQNISHVIIHKEVTG